MSQRYYVIPFLMVLVLFGCARSQLIKPGQVDGTANAAVPVHLSADQFVGHTLSLLSDSHVEWYSFKTNGVVLASLGSKKLVVAPVFDWKIVDDDTLVITDTPEGEHTLTFTYRFTSFAETLAVTTDGKRFKRE